MWLSYMKGCAYFRQLDRATVGCVCFRQLDRVTVGCVCFRQLDRATVVCVWFRHLDRATVGCVRFRQLGRTTVGCVWFRQLGQSNIVLCVVQAIGQSSSGHCLVQAIGQSSSRLQQPAFHCGCLGTIMGAVIVEFRIVLQYLSYEPRPPLSICLLCVHCPKFSTRWSAPHWHSAFVLLLPLRGVYIRNHGLYKRRKKVTYKHIWISHNF
jgi:hypothetical protein